MAGSAANFIRGMISKNNVAVFSKSYCGFCKLAKECLTAAGASTQAVVELDLRPDGDDIQDELKSMTGQATVPQVFINQTFVGGGTDVDELHKNGKLKDMISKAKASL